MPNNWKTGDDETNIILSNNLRNVAELIPDGVQTNERSGSGLFLSNNSLNVPESEYRDARDYSHGSLKAQGGYPLYLSDELAFRRYKDVIYFAKLKMTDRLFGVKVVSRGAWDSVNADMRLWLADPETQVPVNPWVTNSVTTTSNGITLTDNDALNRQEITLSGEFARKLQIRAGDNIKFTNTGISQLDGVQNFVLYSLSADTSSGELEWTFYLREDDASGAIQDWELNQSVNGTVSIDTSGGIAHCGVLGVEPNDGASEDPTPSLQYGSGEVLQWNLHGRSIMEIYWEQYFSTQLVGIPTTNARTPKVFPRRLNWDDHVYFGINFLGTPTFDSGFDYNQLGMVVTYASQT